MSAVRLPNSRVTPLSLPTLGAGVATERGGSRRVDTAHTTNPSPPSDDAQAFYFAGPENKLVAAGIERMMAAAESENAGRVSLRTLTLIGPTGSGKSLLASGVRSAWAKAHGEDRVLSVTGVDLRRQLERAIGSERDQPGLVEAITERLAGVKLLIVEGVEGLAASEPTVALLTATLDRLEPTGGHTLVTASKPLGEIAGLDTRVVSRLAGGLTLEVAAPAEATRCELLTASLTASNCRIEPTAAADLAAWLPADARRVLAAADQLANRYGKRTLIDRHRIKAFITEATQEESSMPLADIAAVVARYYSMPLRQLRSSSRKAPIVLARAVAIYLARELTPLSYDEIGRYLGGRDHTTVMHNYNRISKQMPRERALRSAIDDLLRKLGRSDAIGSPSLSTESAS